ncbi:hypothetical protein QL285_018009 [Trifolium repens]|nr:hypothetical protein QL285_018009 [Trifolium repens]
MDECTEDFLTYIFTKKETFANNYFDLLLKIKDNIGKITTITHLFGGLVSLLKTRKWEQVHRVSNQVKRSYDALLNEDANVFGPFNMDSLTKLKCKIAHKYEIHQIEEDAETLEKKIKQNVGLEEFIW